MSSIPNISFLKDIRQWTPLALPSLLILLGFVGFLPFRWLQQSHLLFGLLATSPLVNLSFMTLGLLLLNQIYTVEDHPLVGRTKLYQVAGIWFAILAIGGFISLPVWPHLWLNLFTNSLASDALYAGIAVISLIKGFWGHQNALVTSPDASRQLNIVPPQSSNQQQI